MTPMYSVSQSAARGLASFAARMSAKAIAAAFAVLALCLMPVQLVKADEPVALAGLQEVKIAFDLTHADGKTLLSSLNVIDDTRRSLIDKGVTPRMVLAFRGPAAKLIQAEPSDIRPEDRNYVAEIAEKIDSLRSADGINSMEQCGLSLKALGLEPENTVPGVELVENSWVSLAIYQARGYGYVAP